MQVNRCMYCMAETAEPVCPHCGRDARAPEEGTSGLRLGTILNGRYLIGRVLGRGGFGVTYVGFDLALELKVAVKEYFPSAQASRDNTVSNQLRWSTLMSEQDQWRKGCDGFLKEARKMAKVDAVPEIARVRDMFIENSTAYIVMDFVEGETLKNRLLAEGPMTFDACVSLIRPLLGALETIHRQGLIHRDISPDNIMVLPGGEVRLLDLGAAKDLYKSGEASTQMVIKHGFSPMEQYSQNGKIGPWTDVYALCATIYYCVTGQLLPDAADRIDGMEVSFAGASLSLEQQRVLLDGLAVSTGQRIQSMAALEARLEQCRRQAPAPESKPEPTPRPEAKSKTPSKPERQKEAGAGFEGTPGKEKLRGLTWIIGGLLLSGLAANKILHIQQEAKYFIIGKDWWRFSLALAGIQMIPAACIGGLAGVLLAYMLAKHPERGKKIPMSCVMAALIPALAGVGPSVYWNTHMLYLPLAVMAYVAGGVIGCLSTPEGGARLRERRIPAAIALFVVVNIFLVCMLGCILRKFLIYGL